jgi:membrane-associated protein
MDFLLSIWDLIVHLDKHLATLVQTYGLWIYAILFAIIFCETGLVIAPFLPGDSLLFIAGALAAAGTASDGIDVHLLVAILIAAAVLGDAVNYQIGAWLGPRIFKDDNARYLKRAHLEKAHAFYEKWGGMAIILARFTPFLRTYVPFVAGMSRMSYRKFALYNITGGVIWVAALTYLGYFFGNIPWVKANQGFMVIGIVIASLIPVLIGVLKSRPQSGAAEINRAD